MNKFNKLLNNAYFVSFCHTFLTDVLFDQALALVGTQIMNGDFSRNTFYALGYSLFRTALRALRESLKPEVVQPEQDQNLGL